MTQIQSTSSGIAATNAPFSPRHRADRTAMSPASSPRTPADQAEYQRESLSAVAASRRCGRRSRTRTIERLPGSARLEVLLCNASSFNLDPDWILPANGSDENLTIIVRSFADAGDLVCFPYPSYILYETLADIQGARHERLLLNHDWSWDLDGTRPTIEQSRIVFVPNPN